MGIKSSFLTLDVDGMEVNGGVFPLDRKNIGCSPEVASPAVI